MTETIGAVLIGLMLCITTISAFKWNATYANRHDELRQACVYLLAYFCIHLMCHMVF